MKKLFSKYQTIITYILFSSLSFIVDIVSFSSILFFLKDKIMISSYLARTISSIFNYIVNKNIVFKNNEEKSKIYDYVLSFSYSKYNYIRYIS